MTKNATAFLIPACCGFLIAVALGVASRVTGMDLDWSVYIWPTVFILGAISGHATLAAQAMTIGVSAFLNGVLYGVLGWVCFRAYKLLRPLVGTDAEAAPSKPEKT